jgi:hypothetical protein
MNLTHEEMQLARKISRRIQKYLMQTGQKGARTPDVYDCLAREGLVEKDRHQGIHFRNFLMKLKNAGMLKLIPQCTHQLSETGKNEWHFYLASDNRASLKNLDKPDGKKAEIFHKPQMTEDAIEELLAIERPFVELLNKRESSGFKPQEYEIRKNYRRAYEFWSEAEYSIMKRVFIACRNVNKVSELLYRQPHVVRQKLEEFHLI